MRLHHQRALRDPSIHRRTQDEAHRRWRSDLLRVLDEMEDRNERPHHGWIQVYGLEHEAEIGLEELRRERPLSFRRRPKEIRSGGHSPDTAEELRLLGEKRL